MSTVYHEGITAVTKQDIAVGKELGLTLKLLAIGKKGQDGIEVRVQAAPNPQERVKVPCTLRLEYMDILRRKL